MVGNFFFLRNRVDISFIIWWLQHITYKDIPQRKQNYILVLVSISRCSSPPAAGDRSLKPTSSLAKNYRFWTPSWAAQQQLHALLTLNNPTWKDGQWPSSTGNEESDASWSRKLQITGRQRTLEGRWTTWTGGKQRPTRSFKLVEKTSPTSRSYVAQNQINNRSLGATDRASFFFFLFFF
jgi:hypothetical protein